MANANPTLTWLVLSAVTAGSSLAVAAPDGKQAAPAAANEAKGEADKGGAKKKDPAAAERAYAAGVKAYEAGKMSEAVKSLSAALAAGGLPAPQMAKALYYRGAAYRKEQKPAQAISDLTTAVWLKGGLSDVDRAQAMDERQHAYREAGLGDRAPPIGASPLDAPASPAGTATKTAATTATTTTAATTTTTTAAAPPQSSFWSNIFPWASSSSTQASSSTQQAASATPAAVPSAAPPETTPSAAAAAPEQPVWQTATLQQTAEAQPQQTVEAQLQQTVEAQPPPVPVASPAPPASFSTPSLSATVSSSFVESGQSQTSAVTPIAAVESPSPAPSAVPDPSTGSATPSSNPLSGVEKAVTGFFDNVFSSSSGTGAQATAPGTPSSPVTTGATTTSVSSSPPQWHDATIVASTESKEAADPLPWATQSAPTPPPQLAAAPPSSPAVAPPVVIEPTPMLVAATTKPTAAPSVPPPPVVAASATPPEPTPPPIPAAAAPAPSAGKYRLQVAAVRSRDEAERVASSLRQHEALNGGAIRAEIDEAVLGSMGTFYRVRLGPYANAAEPGQLCKSLRPQGFDCLVVTQ